MKTIKLMALVFGVMTFTKGLEAVWLARESRYNKTTYAGGFHVPTGDYTTQKCYITGYYDTTTGDLHTECLNRAGGYNGSVFLGARGAKCNIVNCDGLLACEENCPAFNKMPKNVSSLDELL